MTRETTINNNESAYEQLVVFKLWDQHYAIDIASVHEIILMEHITRVPRTPPFLKGVINLRGKIIPVVDMRKRFSVDWTTEVTEDTRIIIVEAGTAIVGMIVDAVTEVLRLTQEDLEPLPATAAGFDAKFIRAVGKVEDKLVMLLEVSDVFSQIGKNEIA
ncbi:chemotaxis protein CheW [Candidatus Formimonas warabiya]|uniref:Chemotaxis protein CheW n=1 Tax=Formimonas warabiya TaxID=1761012 RepID=A0A3G1KTA4_FORW1|nr:chemotaxis protein CheW [Candidatus Formimonas warabiya]ATW25698.1 hypothetical protein DCMF_13825 [Candidatus Formimonas warabiya]